VRGEQKQLAVAEESPYGTEKGLQSRLPYTAPTEIELDEARL